MAQEVRNCVSTVLIDDNGNFNTDGMQKFEEDAKLEEQGRSCGVVAMMGPQSSGKSTLMNILFDSDFKVLDDPFRRVRTTKGVWLAQTQLQNSCFLVLDTEGSDSAERQDNTTFERQIALLIIATSGIVMINMWFSDVGRREAAGLPLLSIVFQVMLRILKPRKVHLIFVVRDCPDLKVTEDRNEKTRSEKLKDPIERQLEEIWNKLPESKKHKNTALHDLFEIEVVPLSHFVYQKEQFEKDVATLRNTIVRTLEPSELTTNRIAFIQHTENIWGEIKKNKDLDLPSLKVTVAQKHCSKIFQICYEKFRDDVSWTEVKKEVHLHTVVKGFGDTVNSLINTYLSKYDMETEYFDEGARADIRKQLKRDILQIIEGTYKFLLKLITTAAMKEFVTAIQDGLYKKNNKMERLEKIVQDQTTCLLKKIRDQFEDAAIEQADWNHATTKLKRFKNKMDTYVENIRPIIEKKGDEGVLEAVKMGLMIASLAVGMVTGIPSLTGG